MTFSCSVSSRVYLLHAVTVAVCQEPVKQDDCASLLVAFCDRPDSFDNNNEIIEPYSTT